MSGALGRALEQPGRAARSGRGASGAGGGRGRRAPSAGHSAAQVKRSRGGRGSASANGRAACKCPGAGQPMGAAAALRRGTGWLRGAGPGRGSAPAIHALVRSRAPPAPRPPGRRRRQRGTPGARKQPRREPEPRSPRRPAPSGPRRNAAAPPVRGRDLLRCRSPAGPRGQPAPGALGRGTGMDALKERRAVPPRRPVPGLVLRPQLLRSKGRASNDRAL